MKRSPITRNTPLRKRSAKREAWERSPEGKAAARHLDRVRALPCVICGKLGPNDPHHVNHDRYSQVKVPDDMTIPLCQEDHRRFHAGKETWRQLHGADYDYLPLVKAMLAARD